MTLMSCLTCVCIRGRWICQAAITLRLPARSSINYITSQDKAPPHPSDPPFTPRIGANLPQYSYPTGTFLNGRYRFFPRPTSSPAT